MPDHENFQRNLRPDFSVQQSAENENNLHQVVEIERKAGLEKMGQSPKNFGGRALASHAVDEEKGSQVLFFQQICFAGDKFDPIG